MSSRGVNKWIGIGNLCADPDVRYTAGGSAVANVNIACNESYKDRNTGETVDKVEFVRLVFFGKLAEIVQQHLKKGATIFVEGRLQTRKWQDNSGQDRYTTEIVANELTMLGGRQQDNSGQNTQSRPPQSGQQYGDHRGGSSPAPAPAGSDDFDDDIPF